MADYDAALIRTWNDLVDEDDDVWHLGDFMSVWGGDCDELSSKHLTTLIVAKSRLSEIVPTARDYGKPKRLAA
jgi:calcineurin-like phosphoesterase family protein